jgi:transcription antitermination factor NusG
MSMNWLGLAPGDMVDPVVAPDPAALFNPGPRRWYALRVAPQSEARVEGWLARRGVYAFHPVLRLSQMRRGRRVCWTRAYLPGYVFARFDGVPRYDLILAEPGVLGAVSRADGEWGVLDRASMHRVHAMRDLDRAAILAEVADRARARAARVAMRTLTPGRPALFRAGPLAGQVAEVVDLCGADGVRLRLRLFGAEVLVTAGAGDLVGLAGGASAIRGGHAQQMVAKGA